MKVITPDEYVDYMHVGQHGLTIKRENLSRFSNRDESVIEAAIANGELTPIYDDKFKKLEVCAWTERLLFAERENVHSFYKDGYVHIPEWLDSDLISSMNEWLDEIEAGKSPELTPVYTPSVVDGSLMIERISNLEKHERFWNAICNLKPFHDLCKTIYGNEPYVITNARVIFKKPGCPPILVHRDGGWSRLTSIHHPMMTTSISLTDVSKADGGLGFLPGSNTKIDDDETTVFDVENDFAFENPKVGTMVMISQGLLHGTVLSTKSGTRRSLQLITISKTDIENFIEIKGYERVKSTITYRGRNNIFNN